MPSESDMRYSSVHARLAEIDRDEMRDLVENAWALCVPRGVADEYATTQGYYGRVAPAARSAPS